MWAVTKYILVQCIYPLVNIAMDPQYSKGSLDPGSRNRQAPAASGFKTHAFLGNTHKLGTPEKAFFIRTELVPCTGGSPRGHHGCKSQFILKDLCWKCWLFPPMPCITFEDNGDLGDILLPSCIGEDNLVSTLPKTLRYPK